MCIRDSRQAHEIFGRGAGIGRRRRALEHFLFDAAGDARDSLADQRARALAGETVPAEYQFRSAANQSSWIELHFKTVEIEGRTRLLAVLRDISERKQVEARLQYHALHDALTGLPNRAMILGRLQELLDSRYPRYERSALLLLDINRFKVINDSLGQDVYKRQVLEWRMVWINNGNQAALGVRVTDVIPVGTVYEPNSLRCEPSGGSTVTLCAYDPAQNRVVYEGKIAADPGAVDENAAQNEVCLLYTSRCV